jgi:hypothetical protein
MGLRYFGEPCRTHPYRSYDPDNLFRFNHNIKGV